MGLRNFVSGCTSVISGEDQIVDPIAIKSMVFKTPNKTIEYLGLQLMVFFYDGEDYIEGVYPCPLCGVKQVSRKTEDEDLRDRITDLDVTFMTEEDYTDNIISIEMEGVSPIMLKSGEPFEVTSFSCHIPTLEDHHKAYTKHGNENLIRFQLAVYAESIETINGEQVDNEWRKLYGMKLFENMTELKKDTDKLSKVINKYGTDLGVKKVCRSCGEVWRPVINTSNFFGFALQSL